MNRDRFLHKLFSLSSALNNSEIPIIISNSWKEMQTAKNTIWIHFKDCNKMQASFSLCEKPQVLGQLKERLGKRLYISPEMFTLGNMKGLAVFFFKSTFTS